MLAHKRKIITKQKNKKQKQKQKAKRKEKNKQKEKKIKTNMVQLHKVLLEFIGIPISRDLQ